MLSILANTDCSRLAIATSNLATSGDAALPSALFEASAFLKLCDTDMAKQQSLDPPVFMVLATGQQRSTKWDTEQGQGPTKSRTKIKQ